MQWIPGSMLECSGFYAEWCNVSRLNEVDSMQLGVIDTDGMQWIPCSVTECTGFHAALGNASRVNAVDCMQRGAKYPG